MSEGVMPQSLGEDSRLGRRRRERRAHWENLIKFSQELDMAGVRAFRMISEVLEYDRKREACPFRHCTVIYARPVHFRLLGREPLDQPGLASIQEIVGAALDGTYAAILRDGRIVLNIGGILSGRFANAIRPLTFVARYRENERCATLEAVLASLQTYA